MKGEGGEAVGLRGFAVFHGLDAPRADRRMHSVRAYLSLRMPAAFTLRAGGLRYQGRDGRVVVGVDFELRGVKQFAQGFGVDLAVHVGGEAAAKTPC